MGRAAPQTLGHRQDAFQVDSTGCTGYRSNKKTPTSKALSSAKKTPLISESQVCRVPRKRYFTASLCSLPTENTQSGHWVPLQSNISSEDEAQKHSLTAALRMKGMISTAVTCTSHCNLKRRQTSRWRLPPGAGAQPHQITDALPFSSLLLIFTLPMPLHTSSMLQTQSGKQLTPFFGKQDQFNQKSAFLPLHQTKTAGKRTLWKRGKWPQDQR